MNKALHITLPLLTLLATSCAMMTDDRADCPVCQTALHVNLRYDYNMQRADMLAAHASQATVYVTDPATGRVVDMQTASRPQVQADSVVPASVYAFNFDELPAGSYRVYATAQSPTTGAYAPSAVSLGADVANLSFSLPSATPSLQLDTLWTALAPIDVTVADKQVTEASLPLMRLTNNLSIMLYQTQTPSHNSHDMYAVTVTDANQQLDLAGRPLVDAPVTYGPYDQTTIVTEGTDADGQPVATQTAHYDLSLSRLISHDDTSQNAQLKIVNSQTGDVILSQDLVLLLARARSALSRNYPIQEFLDREYDYHLDVILAGNQWVYMKLTLSVLDWNIRIQNEKI